MISIIASGRVGLNYQDFSKKINKRYLETLFHEILPNDIFDFKIVSRDLLDTKLTNEIVSLEVETKSFSNDILSYKEKSKPPKKINQYIPISDLPSSFKDISYSVKDYNKVQELKEFILNYQNEIIKNIFIFDYFNNEKAQVIKIGFRFIFQSKEITLTSSQVDLIYNDIISKSLEIDGISIPGI